jgi:hypothetical protein
VTLETNAGMPNGPTQPSGSGSAKSSTTQHEEPPGASTATGSGRGPNGSVGAVLRRVPAKLTSVPAISRDRLKQEMGERFRMPGTADPKVQLRRLAGVATWAALLGFGGLVTVARIVLGLFTKTPLWYIPTMCVIGLFGLACTIGAFASVHRRRTPWILLVVATVTLLMAWAIDFSR